MGKSELPTSYTFHPYKPYLILGILGLIFAAIFCAAGIYWMPKREVNSNAAATLFISGCSVVMSIYSFLGYRERVVVTSNRITILNELNRGHTELCLDLFTSVYFVSGPQAFQYMVLTRTTNDLADIRKIAHRNISGLLLHVGEHIVIQVWPKDIKTIEKIIGDTVQVVHI